MQLQLIQTGPVIHPVEHFEVDDQLSSDLVGVLHTLFIRESQDGRLWYSKTGCGRGYQLRGHTEKAPRALIATIYPEIAMDDAMLTFLYTVEVKDPVAAHAIAAAYQKTPIPNFMPSTTVVG